MREKQRYNQQRYLNIKDEVDKNEEVVLIEEVKNKPSESAPNSQKKGKRHRMINSNKEIE